LHLTFCFGKLCTIFSFNTYKKITGRPKLSKKTLELSSDFHTTLQYHSEKPFFTYHR